MASGTIVLDHAPAPRRRSPPPASECAASPSPRRGAGDRSGSAAIHSFRSPARRSGGRFRRPGAIACRPAGERPGRHRRGARRPGRGWGRPGKRATASAVRRCAGSGKRAKAPRSRRYRPRRCAGRRSAGDPARGGSALPPPPWIGGRAISGSSSPSLVDRYPRLAGAVHQHRAGMDELLDLEALQGVQQAAGAVDVHRFVAGIGVAGEVVVGGEVDHRSEARAVALAQAGGRRPRAPRRP
jgi:hypothetical protein